MARYFMKRVGMMAVAMFFISLLTFVVMHAVPGGPFTGEKKLSAEIEAAMNEKYHLNEALPLQFVDYLKGVVRGDFGPSYKYPGKTVNEFIADGFPVSAKLGGITIVFVLLAAYGDMCGGQEWEVAGHAGHGSGDGWGHNTVLCDCLTSDLFLCPQIELASDLRH